MMNGLLCLKWNNHGSAFYKTINNHRLKESYCDTTIVCHGKYFPVHRLVLIVCSEYFEEIFERTKCKHPFIIVKDIQPPEMEALLTYMYKGEVNVLQDLLPGLIKAAEALKIKGLAVPDDEAISSDEDAEPSKERKRGPISSPPSATKRSRRSSTTTEKNGGNLNISDAPDVINIPKEKNNRSEELSSQNLFKPTTSAHQTFDDDHTPNVNKNEISNSNEVKVEPIEFTNDPSYTEDEQDEMENEGSLFQTLLGGDGPTTVQETNRIINEEPSAQCSSWEENLESSNEDKLMSTDSLPDDIRDLRVEDLVEPSIPELISKLCSSKSCPHCDLIFVTNAEKKKHINKVHAVELGLVFKCDNCPYRAKNRGNLNLHMHQHTGAKPYACKYCNYKSSHPTTLRNHEKVHTGDKPFSCDICEYKATRPSLLRGHYKSIHGETLTKKSK